MARLNAMPRPEDLPPIEAQRREAEAILSEMDDLFRRTQTLSEQKVTTEEVLTTRRSKLASAQAQLDRIKCEEARLRAGAWNADKAVSAAAVAQARAELEQMRVQAERHTIAAPAAGQDTEFTVLQLNVRPGETVSAAWTHALIVLGDLKTKNVRTDIDEHDLHRFRADLPAVAQVRGGDLAYPLLFQRIEPYVIPKRSLTGDSTERVDTRVLQVLYQIDETGRPPVFIGQQLDVFIDLSEHRSRGRSTTTGTTEQESDGQEANGGQRTQMTQAR